jgi:hypothetical protein
MDVTAGLIIFSGLAAWLSARHRASVPALIFGALATVLFCSTSLGSGLPVATAAVVHWTSNVGGQVAGQGGAR